VGSGFVLWVDCGSAVDQEPDPVTRN
jgi:hypothetical protein